ncbi:MAG TPA: hypothetical protein VKV04_04205, partial [Verrucomicrobiae bacterium]|nr:hypothetical protein [Verrucomicrobiae bacterium]
GNTWQERELHWAKPQAREGRASGSERVQLSYSPFHPLPLHVSGQHRFCLLPSAFKWPFLMILSILFILSQFFKVELS